MIDFTLASNDISKGAKKQAHGETNQPVDKVMKAFDML
jgi:hypothetical protein